MKVLSIIGEGTFTSQELREHFYKRTAVGERLAEMVLNGKCEPGSNALLRSSAMP